jgi:hypothetical protein
MHRAPRIPPGVEKPPPTTTVIPEGVVEYQEKTKALKKKYIGDRRYWYLNLIGRHPDRLDKGECL